jgi:toxin ParE1/3/4
MPGSYRLTPLAFADLEDIWDYTVETWSVAQAEVYHQGIVDALEGLAEGSRVGSRAGVGSYFKYAVGLHHIYYRQADRNLAIIRILHQRMDASRHL